MKWKIGKAAKNPVVQRDRGSREHCILQCLVSAVPLDQTLDQTFMAFEAYRATATRVHDI